MLSKGPQIVLWHSHLTWDEMNSINSTCDSWSPRWYENSSSLEYIVYCFLTEHWFTINISSKAPPSPCYNPDVHVFNGVITLAIVKQFREEKEEFLIPIISNGVRFVGRRLPIWISYNILCFKSPHQQWRIIRGFLTMSRLPPRSVRLPGISLTRDTQRSPRPGKSPGENQITDVWL